MDRRQSGAGTERFSAYLDGLASVLGHAARIGPMRDGCTGLLLSCERKSVEPIAAATAPAEASAQHQSLLFLAHFLSLGEWSDAAVLGKVREQVLPRIERHGAIEVWVVDDTGFPKYGSHSVGVSHASGSNGRYHDDAPCRRRASPRRRIERDYHELKQEVGLGHFEGRPCAAWLSHDAGAVFTITPRCASPLKASSSPKEAVSPCGSRSGHIFKELAIPRGRRPRGSPAST